MSAIRFAAGSFGLFATELLAEYFDVNKILLFEGGLLIITTVSEWFIAPLKKLQQASETMILKHQQIRELLYYLK